MDEVNVAVIAPILGRDLSFVSDVDPRVRVFDANFAAPGHRAGPGGPAAPGSDRLAAILAQAEVLLVGYPVPEGLAARSPRLAWAHHTQAGVSNLAGTDLWGSEVTLTSSRGAVAATAIAEYALAAAAHFARGLHEAARQKAAGQFTREGYQMLHPARGDDGGHRPGRHRPGGGPAVACGRHAGDRHPPLGHRPAARC